MKVVFSMKSFVAMFLVAAIATLTGCAGGSSSVSDRSLDVQTKMSSTVYLTPVPNNQKVVYVQVRNTSGMSGLNLQQQVISQLQAEGYRITNNPDDAHYILQANVLQAGETKPDAAKNLLGGGFGGAVIGGGIGALTGPGSDVSAKNTIGGALIGAAAGAAINAAFRKITYTVTTDVQVSERSEYASQESNVSKLKQGDSAETTIRNTQTTNWRRYQTRVVSTATKVNLKADEALPALSKSIASSIAGMF